MFVPHKPQRFGNEYQFILCDKSKVIYNIDIVDREDQPRVMGKKNF